VRRKPRRKQHRTGVHPFREFVVLHVTVSIEEPFDRFDGRPALGF
jgi:hypothetical protein